MMGVKHSLENISKSTEVACDNYDYANSEEESAYLFDRMFDFW
jgi:hypothetical protein